MRAMICLALIATVGLGTQAATADIYTWVDDDGVRHISNLTPPPHAQVFLRTEESPADDMRMPQASAKQAELELAQEEIRRREERLARQAANLERRIAEIEQKSREALEQAEDRLAAAEARHAEARRDHRHEMAFTYIGRPFGRRHDFREHRRHPAGRDVPVPSFEGHPFHLGAVHIPLFSARDFFRSPGGAHAGFSGSRHPGGGHRPPHRTWGH